ncbi:uncharacterized protein SCHCODRAFT_02638615 [Schizophyllum commune H4-8]|uniref:Expressed protein n=1 Tax=Schizophyllum commune (strain H4-8 / FGSC 9210) TaxID=578458 RepID=D8QFI0_SCHCM|nr:uncharacterized protein SCHCODRAFT_02638615 [Schizophyllum commune H4-8]KAI5887652.1 hypothetical protein SCHCODRAFT_02638615 [Schizophyllum commune H4-8]
MPGPNNSKKKKQQKKKAAKAKRAAQAAHDDSAPPTGEQTPEFTKPPSLTRIQGPPSKARAQSRPPSSLQRHTSHSNPPQQPPSSSHPPHHAPRRSSPLAPDFFFPSQQHAPPSPLPAEPFIYDPGNGPRVRDARAFVDSRFFAHAPAYEDPLCAEFAQEEVLEMLMTVLPDELALILWYNKSRLTSRICPSCRRLYNLGQALPDLIEDGDEDDGDGGHSSSGDEGLKYGGTNRNIHPHAPPNPLLEREQMISGLCSPVCFILAAFDYPGAIKSAWGAMAEEMDDRAWEMLNRPVSGNGLTLLSGTGDSGGEGHESEEDALKSALGMLVRMTRLHDLGLAQLLCMPEEAGGEGGEDEPVHGEEDELVRGDEDEPVQGEEGEPVQGEEDEPVQGDEDEPVQGPIAGREKGEEEPLQVTEVVRA